MAQLKITVAQAAVLIGLRTLAGVDDSTRKAEKKAVFAAIREQFNIPRSVKLKVEIDDRHSPAYLVLKDKTTGADLVGFDGLYMGIATNSAPTARFSTGGAVTRPSTGFSRVAISTLLEVLRNEIDLDTSDVEEDVTLPAGAPTPSADGLLLDNQEGYAYFVA